MRGEHNIARRKPCCSTLLSTTNLTKSALWSNSGLHSEDCQCKEAATWIIVNHTAEMMWGKASLSRHNPEIYLKVVNKTKATFVTLVLCCSGIRHPDSHTRGQNEISRLRDSVFPKTWLHKFCPYVYVLRQEECRQRSTYSSPLHL